MLAMGTSSMPFVIITAASVPPTVMSVPWPRGRMAPKGTRWPLKRPKTCQDSFAKGAGGDFVTGEGPGRSRKRMTRAVPPVPLSRDAEPENVGVKWPWSRLKGKDSW